MRSWHTTWEGEPRALGGTEGKDTIESGNRTVDRTTLSPPLVYMIRRRTVRFQKCTLYSHPRSFGVKDVIFVTPDAHNVIFSSLETQFKVVPT